MTGVAAAFAEAWSEVRVHRTRVILSLVGVFLAVFALTTVTALGQMGTQAIKESVERSAGRPATLSVTVDSAEPAAVDAAYSAAVERYGISWSSRVAQTQITVRFPSGAQQAQAQIVDPEWGLIHRVVPNAGRWFTEADTQLFAPAIVVNPAFAELLGGVEGRSTVMLGGSNPVLATVIGVTPERYGRGEPPMAYMLWAAAGRWLAPSGQQGLEVWVPPEAADGATEVLRRDLRAALPDSTVDVYRQDTSDLDTVISILDWGIRGAGIFGLALGALGVVNVGLVTVRQRIREIGVRRSFGATSGRVFAAVMLESVVATALAGGLAVALSVALVINLPLDLLLSQTPLTDVPPYPVGAAVEGFVAAVLVGALAGLIPATVAVRAKVIDAIRY